MYVSLIIPTREKWFEAESNLLGNLASLPRAADSVSDSGQVSVERSELEEQGLVQGSDVLVEPAQLAAHFISFLGEALANHQHVPAITSETHTKW